MSGENFKNIAEQIISEVGRDNIVNATHCMTRLRLNLKKSDVVDDEKIKSIKGVIGVNRVGEQYQIIIGQTVDKVFSELKQLVDFSQNVSSVDKSNNEKLTFKTFFSKTLDYISGSMTPLIPAMITAAMFKTVQVIAGPDLLGLVSKESDLYLICGFLYDAFFYFLPLFLGLTAAKKLGANQIMGLMLGALLLVPGLITLDGKVLSIYGFIPATIHNYSQTVLPAVLSVWVMSYVETFFKKVVPSVLSTIFVPFLTMVVMTPISLALLSPLGSVLGQWIGGGLLSFGNFGGFMAIAIVAALWEFLVMGGMHMVLITFALTALMTNGVDKFVMVAAILATWATFGLALGASLKLKNKDEKALSFGYLVSGLVGGVTEPTIYGVILKYKRTIATLAIGGFFAGAYAGLTNVGVYVAGASNFLSVVGYFAGGTSNIINGFIATAIAFFGTAILTYFFGFSKKDLVTIEENFVKEESDIAKSKQLASPLNGRVLPLNQVPDQVFASGAMGNGIAIKPDQGIVCSPADAKVTVLFPTGHAIGLKTDDGVEVLIHIGMDTVNLEGEGFESLVVIGEKVKKGQELIKFDIEKITASDLTTITPIIITNTADYSSFIPTSETSVEVGDFLIEIK